MKKLLVIMLSVMSLVLTKNLTIKLSYVKFCGQNDGFLVMSYKSAYADVMILLYESYEFR